MPQAANVDALNAKLLDGCRARLGARLRGHTETIGERLVRDLAAFQALPTTPYDACEKKGGRVSSLSLVRYRGTDYSVPTAYGHREVLIRGYVHEVVISCGAAPYSTLYRKAKARKGLTGSFGDRSWLRKAII
jgi:hypothetical protein